MMPEISGLNVLKNLKSDPLHRNIPVIMVTAADEVETAAECITVGADDLSPNLSIKRFCVPEWLHHLKKEVARSGSNLS